MSRLSDAHISMEILESGVEAIASFFALVAVSALRLGLVTGIVSLVVMAVQFAIHRDGVYLTTAAYLLIYGLVALGLELVRHVLAPRAGLDYR